ncbi:Phosphinothricin N-acetyltransferase [Usitatibacter rugosus]|uniref:Phosphinothricin N-acetyltransferase n=1 Tax=Usitatibacter rugosus TaxID=2732067 RepID=A0A6M4GT89_9PROT|nr:GNAT family N-acetyltransferase [Usitatibacter rugosus]QJR09704.1 Phosphinothricin N-acetyltransferase [Usitatibacter rugosus]
MKLREATAADIEAIAAIYGHHVRTGLASFEIDAPDAAEMQRRFEALRAKGFPYLVAEADGAIAGYAYASLYRERFAYRFTCEDSVYVDARFAGRGIGRALLEALVEACAQRGYRQMIAVIGDSANAASIAVHRACGFELTGTFRSIGFKHGRWVDTVLMQRTMGEGDRTPP